MRKLALTMSAALLVLGSMAWLSGECADTERGSSQRSRVKECDAGRHPSGLSGLWSCIAGPDILRVCGPYRCWCRPCLLMKSE